MSYVYLVASRRNGAPQGPVKIGRTNNLKSRLKAIQTGSARHLEYYEIWDFSGGAGGEAAAIEGCFHHMERWSRLAGEWFGIAPERAKNLMELYIRWTYSIHRAAPDNEINAIEKFGILGEQFDRRGVSL
jgi:hypothetical protein